MPQEHRHLEKVAPSEAEGGGWAINQIYRVALPPICVSSVCFVGTSTIPVVCALIERGGLILLAQRPGHKHLPLKWEFPGGKVEPGEDPAAAIVREIREELGCDVTITRVLPRFLHDYGTVVIEMIPFACELAKGSPEPHLHEHVAIAWVKPAELLAYDLAAADLPVVKAYSSLPF